MSTVATGIRISLSGLFGSDGHYFEFSRPLELEMEENADGVWEYRLPALDILSFGPTRQIAFESLIDSLAASYKVYALAEDTALSTGARKLKQQLLAGIKKVH